MSLIYKRKSTGPNTKHCGTPNVIFDIEERQFLIETYYFLLLIRFASPTQLHGVTPVSVNLKCG